MAERQSSLDMLHLVAELNVRRIAIVLRRRERKFGHVPLTKEQEDWLLTARKLHQRYKRGVYMHDDQEAAKVIALCKWLVSVHCLVEGIPDKEVVFDPSSLYASRPVEKGSYDTAIAAVCDS